MSFYTGTIVTVEAQPRQANVTTDAAAGSSLLLLDDVGPFREAGGQAIVDGVLLSYLTIDSAAESMTLAAPLAATVTADSTVQVAIQGVGALDWVANVLLDGQEGLDDDPVPAQIPYELIGYLREGVADAGKVVTLSATAAGLYLDEIDGGNPQFDGSTLDPDIPVPVSVVPPAPPPPPVAPTASPTPVTEGVPGAIFIRLPPPASANTPTVVDVYMSTSSPVALDATHLHGTAAAGAVYTVTKLPAGMGGGPLSYYQADGVTPQIYLFVAVARSAQDGSLAATPSSEVAGSMRQVDSPDVSVNAVWAGWVSAARMTSGLTEAEIVLAGVIESQNPSGPMFGRVGLSGADGFYSRGVVPAGGALEDAPVLVHFPVDGAPNIVSGILQADTLTVTGGATFRAATSLEVGASLTLEQGIQPPKSAPAYVVGYSSTTMDATSPSAVKLGLTKGHDGNWYTVVLGDAAQGTPSYIEVYTAAGVNVKDVWCPNISGHVLDYYGIVYDPVTLLYYLLGYNPSLSGRGWYIVAIDQALGAPISTFLGLSLVTNNGVAFGWDYTLNKALVAYTDKGTTPANRWRVDSYTVGLSGAVTYSDTWLTPTTHADGADMGVVLRGKFDYGDTVERTILRTRGNNDGAAGTHPFFVFTTSSNARRSQDEWPNAADATTRGATYSGGQFWSIDGSDRVWRYQGGRSMWTSGSSRWSFDARFLDSKTTMNIPLSTTSASKNVVSSTYMFGVGDLGVAVSGSGIPAGATIESVTPGTGNATVSIAATATAAITATLTSVKHETGPSPRASFTMLKRALVTLTLATPPVAGGGVNDPDSLRVYYGKGDTDAATTMVREKTLAVGVIAMTFDGTGTAEGGTPDVGFVNSTPAAVQAAALDPYGNHAIDLRGDGLALVEMLTPLGVAYPSMFPITAGSEPKGWYKLDGREILGTLIPIAASVLGTGATSAWGAAAAGNVKLPDMRGRMPIGAGTFAVFGSTDGLTEANRKLRHTHPISAQATHDHNGPSHDHGPGTLASAVATNTTATGAANRAQNPITGLTGAAGTGKTSQDGSHSHGGDTLQSAADGLPYAACDWIVRLA